MAGFALAAPGVLGAFAAGLVSFLSPCVLPLVPVYLSFISGESAADLKEGKARRGLVIARTAFFALGFTLVFTLLGLVFGGGMRFIGSNARKVVNRISGLVILALALNILFDFIPLFRREARVHISRPVAAREDGTANSTLLAALRSLLAGMAFAGGWTPCVGPILSSILLLSGESGDPLKSAILLGAYSAGLAIPFILGGLFLDRAFALFGFFRGHHAMVRIVTAALLFAFSVVLLAGSLSPVTSFFLRQGYALADFAETGPAWFRPIAAFLARWFLFQGA